ncbi:MAG TPA: LacI family DNA-binding transcriptional regulator [Lacipirellula sp.]
MAATIYDIARQAGVSSSTVARVLRGDTKGDRKDSAERAARIRQIAQNLGYRPNLRARAFSEQRTRGVGLLYTDDSWVFEGVNDKVIQGLVQQLRKHEYHLLLLPIDDGGEWEDVVLGGHVDGCVTFQFLPEAVRAGIRDTSLPCVLLGDNSDPELPHIVVDDVGGAYTATRHLISLGHRRIGLYFHHTIKPHCSVPQRREGYENAMREEGLQPQIWHCGEDEMMAALIRKSDRPTGLICYSDLESTLIRHATWQYGMNIPGDLSLIGFNDKFATKYMTPPLTTVGFDANQIGADGAQMIIHSLNGNNSQDNGHRKAVTIKTQLIVRGSTAAPA